MKSTLRAGVWGRLPPVSVSAMGGPSCSIDDQETPNTLKATFCFDGAEGSAR